MNEDFVTYELAVKLKEKGFREECIATYDIEDKEFDFNNYILRVAYQMNLTAKYCLRVFNDSNCGLIDAPTISQVLKWLRKEKKIVISIFPHPCGWQADIYKDVHQYYDSEAECYLMHYYKEKTEISHSYNWLEIYCIQYVLDNLI